MEDHEKDLKTVSVARDTLPTKPSERSGVVLPLVDHALRGHGGALAPGAAVVAVGAQPGARPKAEASWFRV